MATMSLAGVVSVLLVAILVAVTPRDTSAQTLGVPSYFQVTTPTTFPPVLSGGQFVAELWKGWRNKHWDVPSFGVLKLTAVEVTSSCRPLSPPNGRALLVRLRTGCSFASVASALQEASPQAVFLWSPGVVQLSLQPLPVDSGLLDEFSAPFLTLTSQVGDALATLVATRQLSVLHVIEPAECLSTHVPKLSSIVIREASSLATSKTVVEVTATFASSTSAAQCWFFDIDTAAADPCIVQGALSSKCQPLVSDGIWTNTPLQNGAGPATVQCELPQSVMLRPNDFVIAVEAAFASVPTTYLRCFSHQHQPVTSWTPAMASPLSSAPTSSNASVKENPCDCSPDGVSGGRATGKPHCSLNVQQSNHLWCYVRQPSECPSALISGTYSPAAARPCFMDPPLPGVAGHSCAASCQGSACTVDDRCVCRNGYTGSNCTRPICDQGCIQGVCVAPSTCRCSAGYGGQACNTPLCADQLCSGHGTCARPGFCACDAGYTGSKCERKQQGSDQTHALVIVVASLCGAVGLVFLVLLVRYIVIKQRPIVTLQPPPRGSELGPLVSRVVTVKRRWLWFRRTEERIESVHQNDAYEVYARMSGQLPSYAASVASASASNPAASSLSSSRRRSHSTPVRPFGSDLQGGQNDSRLLLSQASINASSTLLSSSGLSSPPPLPQAASTDSGRHSATSNHHSGSHSPPPAYSESVSASLSEIRALPLLSRPGSSDSRRSTAGSRDSLRRSSQDSPSPLRSGSWSRRSRSRVRVAPLLMSQQESDHEQTENGAEVDMVNLLPTLSARTSTISSFSSVGSEGDDVDCHSDACGETASQSRRQSLSSSRAVPVPDHLPPLFVRNAAFTNRATVGGQPRISLAQLPARRRSIMAWSSDDETGPAQDMETDV